MSVIHRYLAFPHPPNFKLSWLGVSIIGEAHRSFLVLIARDFFRPERKTSCVGPARGEHGQKGKGETVLGRFWTGGKRRGNGSGTVRFLGGICHLGAGPVVLGWLPWDRFWDGLGGENGTAGPVV